MLRSVYGTVKIGNNRFRRSLDPSASTLPPSTLQHILAEGICRRLFDAWSGLITRHCDHGAEGGVHDGTLLVHGYASPHRVEVASAMIERRDGV